MAEIEIIAFTDENGGEFPFEVMDRLEYKGRKYVVLLPVFKLFQERHQGEYTYR